MNNTNLVGRITKDIANLGYTSSNKAVVEVSIAINNGKDDTTFLNITCFGKTAELVKEYCHKGDLIGVSCIIKNHNWEDEKGKHYDYTFIANKVSFLSTKKEDIKEEQKDPYEEYGANVPIDDNFLD